MRQKVRSRTQWITRVRGPKPAAERLYETIVGYCGNEPDEACYSCVMFPDCPNNPEGPQQLPVKHCRVCTVIECNGTCIV